MCRPVCLDWTGWMCAQAEGLSLFPSAWALWVTTNMNGCACEGLPRVSRWCSVSLAKWF